MHSYITTYLGALRVKFSWTLLVCQNDFCSHIFLLGVSIVDRPSIANHFLVISPKMVSLHPPPLYYKIAQVGMTCTVPHNSFGMVFFAVRNVLYSFLCNHVPLGVFVCFLWDGIYPISDFMWVLLQ